MQELIALLKQEKDIKLLIEQEEMKQTRLEKTFHEQNTTIYKNNSVIQEQTQKKLRLSQQQTIYENANEKYHLKQKQYVQFIILFNLILLILSPMMQIMTQLGMILYIGLALIAILQIPGYYLYLYKENKTLKQYNIHELISNIKEISKELDKISEKQNNIKTINKQIEQALLQSKQRLLQLNQALTRIEEQKNNIIFSVEYEETMLPEEKTYQKKISKF